MKNYENLRVVYEIESRLNEMEKQNPSGGSSNQDKQPPQQQQGGKK